MLWMNVKRTTFSSTRINQTSLFGDLQKIHIPNISLSTRVETKQGFKHRAVKLLQDEKLCHFLCCGLIGQLIQQQ